MFDLKNKNIIVTGASQGIGKELVCSFATLGANVILLSRNKSKMLNIIKSLEKKKKNFHKKKGSSGNRTLDLSDPNGESYH